MNGTMAQVVDVAVSTDAGWRKRPLGLDGQIDRYLVDPASGHMLVSKIKPCMSQ